MSESGKSSPQSNPWRCLCIVAPWAMLAGASSFAQSPPDYTKGCTSTGCHDSYSKKKTIHPPVGEGVCDACHEKKEGTPHGFALSADGGELCAECHDEDDFPGKVMHPPFESGECTTCHDPHATDSARLLQAPSVGELCAECHEEITEDLDFLHGPVGAGECTSCHNPHASDHAKMLFAEGRAVCAKCHTEITTRIKKGPFSHQPAREDCLACHGPHGGDNRMNLSAQPPDLCTDCHDELADALDDASVQHPPVTTGRACLNCHDPHASVMDHGLLRQPMDLCLSCHNKELGTGERKIRNMARLLAENPNHHGPVAQKDCTACHNPHAGEHFRLLIEAYPERFYAAFDVDKYALCMECHETEMLEDKTTEDATGFRNGTRNLHFLHVNRAVKGRTCRACHDVHASRKPKQIADKVPFGGWAIPINYKPTETGGSCAPGCHKQYRYDREKPVQNLPPMEPSKPNPAASGAQPRPAD